MNKKASLICLASGLLIVLGWSISALCGEIHDAVKAGDLAKVKALLKDSPEFVYEKEAAGHHCTMRHIGDTRMCGIAISQRGRCQY
jgi:hypothetical protein